MMEGVYDVSWTCDGGRVLGAGNDKSIRVWDPVSGRVRHTMTGHNGKVRRAAPASARPGARLLSADSPHSPQAAGCPHRPF